MRFKKLGVFKRRRFTGRQIEGEVRQEEIEGGEERMRAECKGERGHKRPRSNKSGIFGLMI